MKCQICTIHEYISSDLISPGVACTEHIDEFCFVLTKLNQNQWKTRGRQTHCTYKYVYSVHFIWHLDSFFSASRLPKAGMNFITLNNIEDRLVHIRISILIISMDEDLAWMLLIRWVLWLGMKPQTVRKSSIMKGFKESEHC